MRQLSRRIHAPPAALVLALLFTAPDAGTAQRPAPQDLTYLGAFRLPGPSGGSNWGYSGMAMTWYPEGDPQGGDDGFPGSLFAAGHDHHQQVSEISIPVPVISTGKDPGELPQAETLQPFTDIQAGFHGPLEMPVMGLAWLPARGSQATGKLHFCWGQHLQFAEASHGWCNPDLSDPAPAGPWFLKDINNYTANDILFAIPQDWAGLYTQGRTLASGRFREGVWSGLGPALYAVAPRETGDPPSPGDTLTGITTLLLYGENDPGIPEISTDPGRRMQSYRLADQWTGGAWLTGGTGGAVIFAGTKAMGDSWYGFSDGTVWPYEGPYPDIPAAPHNERGYWADSIHAQLIFYDAADLAAVALEEAPSWAPQPYAVYDFTNLLFRPGYDYWNGKRISTGACAWDDRQRMLYIVERLADDEKSIVHVWHLSLPSSVSSSTERKPPIIFSAWPNPFNHQISITVSLAEQADISLAIYDCTGRKIITLYKGTKQQGTFTAVWQAEGAASGMYAAVLQRGRDRFSRNISLVK